MNLVRSLYDRWQSRLHEVTAFGVIGGVNFLLDLLLFNLFYGVFGIPSLTARGFATVLSASSSYFMNKHWTFRGRNDNDRRREVILFIVFSAAGLLIQWGFLGMFKFVLGLDNIFWANLGNIMGVAVAMFFRFWAFSKFVFLQAPPAEETAEREKEPTPV
ncbi:GtrA family protein [Fodinicola acaciae]|uniref:GtrA family protein n=1 Tax=Fodinicola acaciae TaxID=2681555 RepID=UPI0013D3CDA8|nr:GtrA family protein [Fodinicola acaciae]